MRRATRWAAIIATSLIVTTGIARAAVQEKIGSWVLSCPSSAPGPQPCIMRLDKRFFEKAGITGDLEIQAQGKSLVPVITLRGLSTDMLMAAASIGGRAEASIQLGGGSRQELVCAPASAGYFCSPHDAAAQQLAIGLPGARSATIRVSVAVSGMNPLPAQERSIDLSGTKDALSRLRIAGPSQVPGTIDAHGQRSPDGMPNASLNGMMEMADKALKAAGYQNGVAGLQALVAQHMKK